jgi:predicted RNA-binding Zn-ribbon protein involved in translation (DUF1610 family)
MTWRGEPTNCMRHAAANPARTLTIGFVPNENFMSLQMEPITKPPEPAAKRTKRVACVTSMPETPAPQIFCPTCDRPLVYRQTVLGGVKPLERWDYFECPTCGSFVYRDRTRQLRRAI